MISVGIGIRWSRVALSMLLIGTAVLVTDSDAAAVTAQQIQNADTGDCIIALQDTLNPRLYPCDPEFPSQKWEISGNTTQIKNVDTEACLVARPQAEYPELRPCDPESPSQKWQIASGDHGQIIKNVDTEACLLAFPEIEYPRLLPCDPELLPFNWLIAESIGEPAT